MIGTALLALMLAPAPPGPAGMMFTPDLHLVDPQQGMGPGPGTKANVWVYKNQFYYNSAGTGSGSACAVNTSTCTVNVSGIAVGDSLFGCVSGDNYAGSSIASITSVTGGETWHLISGFGKWLSNAGTQDCAYVTQVTTGGESTFTVNVSQNAAGDQSFFVVDARWTGATVTFDTNSATVITASCQTTCTGPSFTPQGSLEFALSLFSPQNNGIAVSSPWSTLAQFPFGDGIAPLMNMTSYTAAVWTQQTSATTTVTGIVGMYGT